jgi:hypothetical protein
MGTVKPSELLNLWAQEKISVEMAIGHILQNLIIQGSTVETLNLTLYQLKADVDEINTDTIRNRKKKPL